MSICLLAAWALLSVRATAQAGPPPGPSGEQIKSDLKEILDRPEFRADSTDPSQLSQTIDSIHKKLVSWWHSFEDFLRRLFPGGHGSMVSVDIRLVYTVVAILAVIALWLVVRVIVQRGGLHRPKRRPIAAVASPQTEETEPELPPDEWIERAARAARENDYRAAFRAVFLAILVKLDRAGKIEFSKDRTNGEYARTLRSADPKMLSDLFTPLSHEFDLHWYGGQPAAESDYLTSLDAYRKLPGLLEKTPPVSPAHTDGDSRTIREGN